MTSRRRLLAVLGVVLVGLGLLVLPVTGDTPTSRAAAADMTQFRAGNIITDQLFFDGSAMSAASVQTFLNVRNPNCVDGPMPCLKRFTQTTPTRAASANCPGTYAGAANESAATIIAKIGQACGISQRVLLVVLQKEEGLVTATGSSLSTTRYQSAMGFGCPDTAACDSTYYGFFNQVYAAAAQYRKYASNPTYYSHRAGMTNNILYNPNSGCGSSPVYIANQATAGLYNYTPYQPNAAALAAGAGSGDSCSAYGNRNFWIYFVNWFGSTQTAGAGDLADLYVATGADSGPLGPVTQGVTCGLRNGGCKQGYASGSIYWSAATGAHAMLGPIQTLWMNVGAENSVLGYPTQSVSNLPGGGQIARFEHGSIYWTTATGARAMLGPIETLWNAMGAQTGALGFPTWSVSNLPTGGQYATFQNGSIYWSPTTGAHWLSGAVRDAWVAAGAQTGALGFPTQDMTTARDGVGRYVHFQYGSIYAANTTVQTLMGAVRDAWVAAGADGGPLGAPTSSTAPTVDGAGRYATFEHGSIYWSAATGARALFGPIETAWNGQGAEQGGLGYPTVGVTATADGVGQFAKFQRGVVFWSPSAGAHSVVGAIGGMWAAIGAERGPLGYPTADEAGSDGVGRFSRFEHGSIYWTMATGPRVMLGPVETAWDAAGAEQGFLGYPVQSVSWAADHVGQYARFQRGVIFWSPSTGAHQVLGAIGALWAATGAERGLLGYPISDELATSDGVGRVSRFQHGSIYWTPTTGARAMLGAIETRWLADGAEAGQMGYPVQSVSWAADHVGQYATFQGGSIYWSPSTGAWEVRGAFLTAYAGAGYQRGFLGYPIGEPYAVNGGQWQKFQHGYVAYSTALRRSWAVRQ